MREVGQGVAADLPHWDRFSWPVPLRGEGHGYLFICFTARWHRSTERKSLGWKRLGVSEHIHDIRDGPATLDCRWHGRARLAKTVQGERAAPREFRSAGDPEKGRRLFTAKGCVRRHAVFGQGGDVGPDLRLTELRGSVTQLAGTMWNHWPAMSSAMEAMEMAPHVFADDELGDVFAYLFLARYAGPPTDPARGAAMYTRSGCARCHGPSGEGGVGPRLRERMVGETPEAILQRVWNHGPRMWELMPAQGVAWPRFEPGELADLLSFLSAGLDARAPTPARGE